MANTFELIASSTVGVGGSSSIDFTSIPATYTDLVLAYSVRSSRVSDFDAVFLRVNGDTASNYSYKFLRGGGSSADSGNNSTASFVYSGQIPATTSTSNTFENGAIYIPNYAASTYKSMSVDAVGENNSASAYAIFTAGLWSSTSAITSLKLYPENGPLFVQYSTAYLYGVKNA